MTLGTPHLGKYSCSLYFWGFGRGRGTKLTIYIVQFFCIHFHTLLKYVTVILLCIAGEPSCTIVHMQITQMNTAVTTTVKYASDSKQISILTAPSLMLYMFISFPNYYRKASLKLPLTAVVTLKTSWT